MFRFSIEYTCRTRLECTASETYKVYTPSHLFWSVGICFVFLLSTGHAWDKRLPKHTRYTHQVSFSKCIYMFCFSIEYTL